METPLLSIIIPTHNSEKYLHRCIHSLTSQSFSRNQFEIIVVDDGSSDNSVEIAKRDGVDTVIETEPCNLAHARNLGVKNAIGTFFAFLDSDCEAKNGWVKNIIDKLQSLDAITGPVGNGNTNSSIAWAEYFIEFGAFHEKKKNSVVLFLPGCNAACTKEAFSKALGFTDLRASEDVLLGQSLRKVGIKLIFCPEIRILHLCRTRMDQVSTNLNLLGKYFVSTRREAPSLPYTFLTKNRMFVPLIFLGKIITTTQKAISAGKKREFIYAFPYIVIGISSYCRGVWKEQSMSV